VQRERNQVFPRISPCMDRCVATMWKERNRSNNVRRNVCCSATSTSPCVMRSGDAYTSVNLVNAVVQNSFPPVADGVSSRGRKREGKQRVGE